MKKIFLSIVVIVLIVTILPAQITHISNGESMATVRAKLNSVIDISNITGNDSILEGCKVVHITQANWKSMNPYGLDSVLILPAPGVNLNYHLWSYITVGSAVVAYDDSNMNDKPSFGLMLQDNGSGILIATAFFVNFPENGNSISKGSTYYYSNYMSGNNKAVYLKFSNKTNAAGTAYDVRDFTIDITIKVYYFVKQFVYTNL